MNISTIAIQNYYAKALVPDYVNTKDWINRDSEYAPWIILHRDDSALTNDVLDMHYSTWRTEEGEDAPFSDFMDFLEKHDYVVMPVENPGVWRPV